MIFLNIIICWCGLSNCICFFLHRHLWRILIHFKFVNFDRSLSLDISFIALKFFIHLILPPCKNNICFWYSILFTRNLVFLFNNSFFVFIFFKCVLLYIQRTFYYIINSKKENDDNLAKEKGIDNCIIQKIVYIKFNVLLLRMLIMSKI